MKKVLALLLTSALAVSMLVGCGSTAEPAADAEPAAEEASEEAAEPAAAEVNQKVAIIFNSTVVDGGYNQELYEHMQELAEEKGFELSYQENVDDTMINDVLRNYASDGYGLIVDAEQYHCEQIAEIAPEFPDVKFGCINSYMAGAPNFYGITPTQWQHVYLSGIMAGKATKTNKIGLITYSIDSTSAKTMLAAFGGGAQASNPDVEIIHVATGSFSDLAAGKEMAASLISQDCDVILCNSGDCNPAVIEYCIDAGIYSVSAITNRNDFDPKLVLGSNVTNNKAMLDMIVLPYLDGTLECDGNVVTVGLNENCEEFVINETVKEDFDQEVFDLIDETAEKIKSGEITITVE